MGIQSAWHRVESSQWWLLSYFEATANLAQNGVSSSLLPTIYSRGEEWLALPQLASPDHPTTNEGEGEADREAYPMNGGQSNF